MYKLLTLVVVICAIVSTSGCNRHSLSITRIVVSLPDASSETMDDQVAEPLINAINGSAGFRDIETQSCKAKTELYVVLEKAYGKIDELESRVTNALLKLPEGTHVLEIVQLGSNQKIPACPKGDIEELVINVKNDDVFASLAFLSVQEEVQRIGNSVVTRQEKRDQLRKLIVTYKDREVRLDEIYDIQVVKTPICIRRTILGREQ